MKDAKGHGSNARGRLDLSRGPVTKPTTFSKIRGGAGKMPLAGHDYHQKTNAELNFIAADAHAAAKAMQGWNPEAEGKYLDQVNNASTVLGYRQRGGQDLSQRETRLQHMVPTAEDWAKFNEEDRKRGYPSSGADLATHVGPSGSRVSVPRVRS